MSSRRATFGVWSLWGLLLAGCGDDAPRRAGGPQAGPEIRVRVLSAPGILFGFPAEVEIIALEDRSLVYRGKLPSPQPARLQGGMLDVAGFRVAGSLRLVPRPGSRAGGSLQGTPGEGGGSGAFPEAGAVSGPPGAERGSGEGDAGPNLWCDPGGAPASDPWDSFLLAHDQPGSSPRRYRGALELHPGDGLVAAVNAVKLEDYVAGVIAAEMPALYPLEALKAQTVASRSYALYSLRLAERRGQSGVFPPDARFQVYGGVEAEHPRVLRALEATRGEVLTYLGRLFRAYFHSTCGGWTARADLLFGEPDIPPLSGNRCGGCDGTRLARWRSNISRETAELAIRRRLERSGADIRMGTLRDLLISETGSDGRVRYVRVEHDLGSFEWRADLFRRAIEAQAPDTIRSTYFRIDRSDDGRGEEFVIAGQGWGHGVGLCQVGSGQLGKRLTYREILARYYPRSEVRRAY